MEINPAAVARAAKNNPPSHIFRLPPELLSFIFNFLACAHAPRDFERWVRVTHVCSYWRRVALDYPNLWTRISLHSPSWALEMLARSKTAPITVEAAEVVGDRQSPMNIALLDILKCLPRIRELSLVQPESRSGSDSDVVDAPFLEQVVARLDAPAPLLESLKITYSHSNYAVPPILSCGSPRLRHLELSRTSIPWWPTIVGGLVSLRITAPPISLRIPIPVLTSILARMPNLEEAHLSWVIAPPRPGLVWGDEPDSLPCISQLYLEDELAHCMAFFNNVTVPPTAVLQTLCIPHVADERPHISFSLEILITCITQNHRHVYAMHVDATGFSVWSKSSPGEGSKWPTESDVPFISISDDPSELPGHYVFMICNVLPMGGLTSVCMEDVVAPEEEWIGLLGNLEALENLEIGRHEGGFLGAFSSGISCPELSFLGAMTPGRLKFRHLRRLTFRKWRPMDFRGQRHIDILKTCLRERCKRGRGLQRLILQDCPEVCADDVVDFSRAVMRVIWVAGGEDDESEDDESEDDEEEMHDALN